MNVPDQTGTYQLPGYLVLMVGLAVLIIWLCLLAVVVGMMFFGTGFNLANVIPLHLEGAMRSALVFQYAVILLSLLALFIFGHVICIFWLASAHGFAVLSMIWLIRVKLGVMLVQLFASNAMPAAVGGAVAALPGLVTHLPFILISAGVLIFAERTLVHRRTQS